MKLAGIHNVLLPLAAMIVLPYSSAFLPGSSGNPERDAYVGQADSTYDAAAHPPHTSGVVSYNPMAPLPETVPAQGPGMSIPAPAPMPR